MNSRDKLQNSLNHRGGPVPIDFGSTAVTGMHVETVAALRDYYGLEKRLVKVHEPYQMLGLIEEDLKQALGVDVEGVTGRNTMFGFPTEDYKPWKLFSGLEVLVPGGFNLTDDGAGGYFIHPEGNIANPPSGHLPKGGYYFDSVIRQDPIDEDALNPEDNLQEFGPISDADLSYFKQRITQASSTGRGVIASFGGTGLGDIALVPAPQLPHPRGIRDVEEWYVSTAIRRDYVHEVFDRQSKLALENLDKFNRAAGDMVDVAFICGTDFGTQIGTFCSPETFDVLYMPYYKRVNDWIHQNTAWKTFKHSCGAIETLMDRLIEAGFDIINPVQCSASGMDAQQLKDKYGDRITFWGGGIDTQRVLPFGTPDEVRKQVRQRLEIFSKNGGYVFNAIHNVQPRTPVENVAAMIETVRDFNK